MISCVEPYDAGTDVFEENLIVQATITDEFKYQKVMLGRTFPLQDSVARYEVDASVKVIDEFMNEYVFEEQDSGLYISSVPFKAVFNTDYQLKIVTSSGKKYISEPVRITVESQDMDVTSARGLNKDGVEGIFIYVNSYDATGKSKRYRYEYEETYKIIAPYWSPLDAYGNPLPTIDPPNPFYHEVFTRPRVQEERVCYNSLISNEILLTDTSKLTEDRVTNYEVLFLPKDAFKITHRYSILVRQLVASSEVYSYYSTLIKLSGQTNLFSQNQPGFVQGNLYSEDATTENVIGYFDVASAKSKRIFFNYEDYFPSNPKPPYIVGCNLLTPQLDDYSMFGSPKFSPLLQQLTYYGFKFVDFNPTTVIPSNNPIIIVRRECGDCTALGSNIKPDFWID